MGFFDDIGNAFKDAGNAIKDAGESAGNAIKNAGESAGNAIKDAGGSAFDFTKHVAQSGALALADGGNLFGNGWHEVFSGNFQRGLSDIAMGMAEAVGIIPGSMVKQYEQALGEASLWSLQQSKKTNHKVCFSAYRAQVIGNIGKMKLQWAGSMENNLREGIKQMPWIDANC